jgi:protein-disulfide isomerase
MHAYVAAVLVVSNLYGMSLAAQECHPMGSDTPNKITQYVSSRTASAETPRIDIISSEPVSDSCYLKLTIKASGVNHPVTLFLSPDRRFISNNIFDLDEPPQDGPLNAKHIEDRLLNEASPRLGSASHVLVEFGDFECPYCGDLARWFNSVPEELRRQYSLVFKHLPLSQHPWAMPAAQLMACIQKLSPQAFWPTYSYIYESQRDIRVDNLQAKVFKKLESQDAPNQQSVSQCFADHAASDIVSRDATTADLLRVRSTPTLFLDGYRVLPIQSEDALVDLLKKHAQP